MPPHACHCGRLHRVPTSESAHRAQWQRSHLWREPDRDGRSALFAAAIASSWTRERRCGGSLLEGLPRRTSDALAVGLAPRAETLTALIGALVRATGESEIRAALAAARNGELYDE